MDDKDAGRVGIGDPVEVRFIDINDGEFWRAAAVTSVSHDSIGVALSGCHMAVRNGQWRTPTDDSERV